jgi:hypothetical protein
VTPQELAIMSLAMRPKRLYPLRPHPEQLRLRDSPKRFKVVPAGRRSGKTERAKRRLVKAAMGITRWDDARYFAGAPTRDQAKAIYWNDLKAMIPRALMAEAPRETDLMIRMAQGTELWVIGMDKPERIEGRPWNGGVLDEYANMKPGAWGENVRPALADRKGWCWLIGVPEGRNHYYDLHQYALHSGDPDWDSFGWKSSDILDAAEVEAARRQLDPVIFEQEYEASFVNFTGRAYYPFLERTHVAKLAYNPRAPLNLCFDFNVEPGVAVVAQEQTLPGQFERDEDGLLDLSRPVTGTGVIGEVHIPLNSNTPAVCARLIKDWGTHEGPVRCYGDASGGNRGTAKLSGSDWDIIKRDLRAHFGDRVVLRVPDANGPERSRVNAVNSRLLAGPQDGPQTIRLMVDGKRAPNMVKDLEGTRVLEGGSGEIDKKATPKLTHMSDALGYYVVREFPIIKHKVTTESLHV